MAGNKETPRQKMIGLMYLVLMALLALNVAKETLNAFVVVNEGLEKTNEIFGSKNEEVYFALDHQKALNPQKVKPIWEKAQEVKKLTSEMDQFIKDIKVNLLMETEGLKEEVADTIHLKYIDQKDNYDVPTNIMCGSADDGTNGKANELKVKINGYKDKLLSLLDEKEREHIKIGLETEGTSFNGVDYTWEMHNFYHTPIVASIVLLSKLQNEVRNAEYDVISMLNKRIKADDLPFDKVVAKVVAPTNYVISGEDYNADIFVAAYSSTQNPEVLLGELDENGNLLGNGTPIDVDKGIGKYSISTGAQGEQNFSGVVRVTDSKGNKNDFPFKSNYLVAKPSVVVSPSALLIFYRGVDNPVDVSVPGIPAENLVVTISGAGNRISKLRNGKYNVKVGNRSPRNVIINVKVRNEDGSTKSLGSTSFVVKRLPMPIATVDRKHDGVVQKNRLLLAGGVVVKYDDAFPISAPTSAASYNVVVTDSHGNYVGSHLNVGKKYNPETEALLKGVRRGYKVNFETVKANVITGDKVPVNGVTLKIR